MTSADGALPLVGRDQDSKVLIAGCGAADQHCLDRADTVGDLSADPCVRQQSLSRVGLARELLKCRPLGHGNRFVIAGQPNVIQPLGERGLGAIPPMIERRPRALSTDPIKSISKGQRAYV